MSAYLYRNRSKVSSTLHTTLHTLSLSQNLPASWSPPDANWKTHHVQVAGSEIGRPPDLEVSEDVSRPCSTETMTCSVVACFPSWSHEMFKRKPVTSDEAVVRVVSPTSLVFVDLSEVDFPVQPPKHALCYACRKNIRNRSKI